MYLAEPTAGTGWQLAVVRFHHHHCIDLGCRIGGPRALGPWSQYFLGPTAAGAHCRVSYRQYAKGGLGPTSQHGLHGQKLQVQLCKSDRNLNVLWFMKACQGRKKQNLPDGKHLQPQHINI